MLITQTLHYEKHLFSPLSRSQTNPALPFVAGTTLPHDAQGQRSVMLKDKILSCDPLTAQLLGGSNIGNQIWCDCTFSMIFASSPRGKIAAVAISMKSPVVITPETSSIASLMSSYGTFSPLSFSVVTAQTWSVEIAHNPSATERPITRIH